jgi:hypothetical protein
MAEIKSTLELALERTKRITITDEEKEEIKRKEISQKASGLSHRYAEGLLPVGELVKQIDKMETNTAATVKSILVCDWIDALSLTSDRERLMRGIEALKEREFPEVKKKLQHLSTQYQNEERKAREAVQGELLEGLRKEGIWGDAVLPAVEGSQKWKESIDSIHRAFGAKMEKVKETLRNL